VPNSRKKLKATLRAEPNVMVNVRWEEDA
jgi:hypothetical protein